MSRIWMAWSCGVLAIAAGVLFAEPRSDSFEPTTLYEKTDTGLRFGGLQNPTSISWSAVPAGYEIAVWNTHTPMDLNEYTYRFPIPGGDVIITYTAGPAYVPDTVSVIVPDGWIAIPFDTLLPEETRTIILVTPYTAG